MKFTKILLATNLFLLQSYLIRFSIGGYPTNLQEILLAILAITFLVEMIIGKRFGQILRNLLKHRITLIFILLSAISFLTVQIQNNLDFLRYVKFFFFAIIFVTIFLETTSEKTAETQAKSPDAKISTNTSWLNRTTILLIGGFGAIAFGIFSCIYNLLGYNVAPDFRLLGPMDAAVYLAYYLTPFFIFFSIKFFETKNDEKTLINRPKTFLFCAIILGILILLTRSAGAIGGAIFVMILYFWKKFGIKFLKSGAAKIALACVIIIVAATTFYTKILPAFQTNYSSLNERNEIWQTSLHLLKDPMNVIFGVGLGQFENTYIQNVDSVLGHKPLDYKIIQPHNIFLLFIFNFGILGLFFIIFCIYKTAKNIRWVSPYTTLQLEQIVAFILIYFFAHGLIDTPFFKNDMFILLLLFLEIGLTKNLGISDTKKLA